MPPRDLAIGADFGRLKPWFATGTLPSTTPGRYTALTQMRGSNQHRCCYPRCLLRQSWASVIRHS